MSDNVTRKPRRFTSILSVSVPESFERSLDMLAANSSFSKSDHVRIALEMYLTSRGLPLYSPEHING